MDVGNYKFKMIMMKMKALHYTINIGQNMKNYFYNDFLFLNIINYIIYQKYNLVNKKF